MGDNRLSLQHSGWLIDKPLKHIEMNVGASFMTPTVAQLGVMNDDPTDSMEFKCFLYKLWVWGVIF